MKLEVGDKIYKCRKGNPEDVFTVDRVTKTLALCGGTRFKRDYENSYIRLHSRGVGYSLYSYRLEEPILKDLWRKNQMVITISKYDLRKVNMNDLESILKIIEK